MSRADLKRFAQAVLFWPACFLWLLTGAMNETFDGLVSWCEEDSYGDRP